MKIVSEGNNNDVFIQQTIDGLINKPNQKLNLPEKRIFNISLEMYDGPLDALYHMVLKHKINIQEIPIVEVCTQLVKYIRKNPDMDLYGDLLNIATRLIYLKSSVLLKRHQEIVDEDLIKESEDLTNQLKEKLEEYLKYKELSSSIEERFDLVNNAFFRNAPEMIIKEEFSTENINKDEIYKALQQMSNKEIDNLKNNIFREINDSNLNKIYKQKILRVEDKIEQINNELFNNNEIIISKYIKDYSKEDKIVTFLAILEMSKTNQIHCLQEINFGEIYITKQTTNYTEVNSNEHN